MKNTSKLSKCLLGILMTFLLIGGMSNAKAENYVRVATIGTKVPPLDKTMGYQKMVDQVIAFWKKEIEQVIHGKPDVIVLPENCDFPGGLTQAEKYQFIQVRKNQILDYFASVAKANRCYMAFSMRREDNGGLWNSGMLLDREGKVAGIYNKNIPTIGEMEAGIKPDTEVPVFQCDFGRVAIALCYDLNFDELRERYKALKPDLIIFPSAYHGGFVQSTWAYTCRSFFVGSISGNGSRSEIRNPLGEIVATSTNYFDYAMEEINLDARLVHLDYNRPKLIALKKKYGSTVTIKDPGGLGAVLVSSENKNVKVAQMLKEFNIELLDDYFKRSMDFVRSHR